MPRARKTRRAHSCRVHSGERRNSKNARASSSGFSAHDPSENALDATANGSHSPVVDEALSPEADLNLGPTSIGGLVRLGLVLARRATGQVVVAGATPQHPRPLLIPCSLVMPTQPDEKNNCSIQRQHSPTLHGAIPPGHHQLELLLIVHWWPGLWWRCWAQHCGRVPRSDPDAGRLSRHERSQVTTLRGTMEKLTPASVL